MPSFDNGYYFLENVSHSSLNYNGRTPSGYIMFRIDGSKVKMQCIVENLNIADKTSFQLFLSSSNPENVSFLSNMLISNGRGEINLTFDKSKMTIDKYDGAHIVTMDNNPIIVLQTFAEKSRVMTGAMFISHTPQAEEVIKNKIVLKPVLKSAQTEVPKPTQNEVPKSDILKEHFTKKFRKYDPFNTTNDSYSWWIPDSFNNVLAIFNQLNINIPSNISRELYEGIGRCGHMLLGFYTDKKTGRCFIIVGVPSTNTTSPQDTSPQITRWVSCVNKYTDTGFTGYFLYYIDSSTSSLVQTVVE